MHVCMYDCTSVSAGVYMCGCVYVCVGECEWLCMYSFMCTLIYVCMHVCACIYVESGKTLPRHQTRLVMVLNKLA